MGRQQKMIPYEACGNCHKKFPRIDLRWAKDKNNLPVEKACPDCFKTVQESVLKQDRRGFQ